MLCKAMLVLPFFAAAGLIAGCGQPTGCSLAAQEITCSGETFFDCTLTGCPISNIGCTNPGHGCQIAPGMTLEHFDEKDAQRFYLCGQGTCGTWTETSCQVTVTSESGGSATYTVHDSTCP